MDFSTHLKYFLFPSNAWTVNLLVHFLHISHKIRIKFTYMYNSHTCNNSQSLDNFQENFLVILASTILASSAVGSGLIPKPSLSQLYNIVCRKVCNTEKLEMGLQMRLVGSTYCMLVLQKRIGA